MSAAKILWGEITLRVGISSSGVGGPIAFRSLGFEVDPERDLAEVERPAARIFTQPVHDCLSSRRLLEQPGEQRELLGSAERFKSTIDAVAG